MRVYNPIMIITELQKRRAENIIWNCARDHSFTPDFRVFDREGRADLYWNIIVGAARRHYDYPVFEEIFRMLDMYEDGSIYEDIFWTALEPLVYEKELLSRPVLRRLRPEPDKCELVLSPDMDTREIADAALDFFFRRYGVQAGKKPRRTPDIPAFRKRQSGSFANLSSKTFWHPKNFYSRKSGGYSPEEEPVSKMTAEELRQFMESKFGKSVFSPRQTFELERELCSGNHQNTHILFTYGEKPVLAGIQSAFEALQRQKEAAQAETNRKYYESRRRIFSTAAAELGSRIMNSVLLHLQPAPVKSDSGSLDPKTAWRSVFTDDGRIFSKPENENAGDICVDILLDASTSQKDRVEIISSQAYVIADALTRCSIPCRLMSFCSMTGYTAVRIFRDYGKPSDNRKIFDYVSNGCNRDGLAIRACRKLLSTSPYEHRILIVLSDVKPNDVVRIHRDGSGESERYESAAGLRDTAQEVRLARAEGISVMCIFTGDDEDLPSARTVYGRDFARVRDFSFFADTVGKLLRNQIRNY